MVTKTTLLAQPGDLAYWLSRSPEERFAAVEELRRLRHGADLDKGIERVVRVTQLKKR